MYCVVLFWVTIPYGLVGGYRYLREIDGGDKFLQNVGNHVLDYTVS
jgi:hypothetical protein